MNTERTLNGVLRQALSSSIQSGALGNWSLFEDADGDLSAYNHRTGQRTKVVLALKEGK